MILWGFGVLDLPGVGVNATPASMSEPAEIAANLPEGVNRFKVLALYKFVALPDAEALKPELAQFCCARNIRGTFILAPEGINGTVAGTPEAIDALMALVRATSPLWAGRLDGAEAKFSGADDMPFLRMKVRLKPEIVTLRAPEANPRKLVGSYVDARDWNRLIDRNDVTVIDTRNDYEVKLGTFARALDPATASFTEFKDYVAKLDPAKHPKVAMFCTGGIRCEKASAYMLTQGFKEVFHLKGGILKYLEVVPETGQPLRRRVLRLRRARLGHPRSRRGRSRPLPRLPHPDAAARSRRQPLRRLRRQQRRKARPSASARWRFARSRPSASGRRCRRGRGTQ